MATRIVPQWRMASCLMSVMRAYWRSASPIVARAATNSGGRMGFGITPAYVLASARDGRSYPCLLFVSDTQTLTYRHAPRQHNLRRDLAPLDWTIGQQRLDPVMVARHGYEYARRKGMVAMVGGKHKTQIRNATPAAFRDLLLGIVRS